MAKPWHYFNIKLLLETIHARRMMPFQHKNDYGSKLRRILHCESKPYMAHGTTSTPNSYGNTPMVTHSATLA